MKSDEKHTRKFYSKLMLFGEYSIIHKSKALAVPFSRFNASFNVLEPNQNNTKAVQSNQQLMDYARFLDLNKPEKDLGFKINLETLLNDINNGLFFDSNIPQGYGVGSSGALIANLYSVYAQVSNYSQIQKQLAWLENYFHGKSSGIDPLVAYLNKPLLFEGEKYAVVKKPDLRGQTFQNVFLIDTKQVGKTAPLVNQYLAKVNEGVIEPSHYSNLVNHAISALFSNDSSDFYNYVKQISAWQFENLTEMIPTSISRFWQKGLIDEGWFLKLCGSGGGGFVYAFVNNSEAFIDWNKQQSMTFFDIA